MTTVSEEPSRVVSEKQRWPELLGSEMWASLAIAVIWLSVLFDAVYGPNIVNTTAGGDQSVVPSAVIVAGFAFFATWVVAKYAFRGNDKK
jgi:hypothetical protein